MPQASCRQGGIHTEIEKGWTASRIMGGNTKVLVAEDEIDIGKNYKIILESRNHQVTLAKDGEECVLFFDEAFRKLQVEHSNTDEKSPFDIVVLDFRMPKKDGVAVARHILSMCPVQKVIFATAYTLDVLDGLMKVQLGIEVLQKPFDLDAFVAMVEDFGSRPLAKQKA